MGQPSATNVTFELLKTCEGTEITPLTAEERLCEGNDISVFSRIEVLLYFSMPLGSLLHCSNRCLIFLASLLLVFTRLNSSRVYGTAVSCNT